MEHIWITVLVITGLLALAVMMLPVAKRLNFPFTVLLAVVGCLLAGLQFVLDSLPHLGILTDFLGALTGFEITSETVFFVFLPALVFESALSIDVHRLMDDMGPLLLLAVVGLLISTFIVGYSLSAVTDVGLVACLLLGAIVSATDPVAVVAIFKDLSVPKRLAILVEGESLFNDATAIVTFSILSAMLLGNTEADFIGGAVEFVKVFVGGVIVGCICAYIVCLIFAWLAGLPIVKTTLTLSLTYLSFIFAEHYLHVSGVMAVVAAALVVGSYGRSTFSPEAWHSLTETWEHIGFWANSLIFILVGMTVPKIMQGVGMEELGYLAILLAATFVARAGVIFGTLPLLSFANLAAKVNTAFKSVMLWGGLRGAVSLALALAVMENPDYPPEVKSFIGVLVTGLVLFTLFINAPTIGIVLKFFGLGQLSPVDQAIRNRAMELSLSNICQSLGNAAREQHMTTKLSEEILTGYQKRADEVKLGSEKIEGISDEDRLRIGLIDLGRQEREAYLHHFAEGFVSSTILRKLLSEADNILDGIKAAGVWGYEIALETGLGFDWRFHLAQQIQRRFGYSGLLARRLADRFEVLLATRVVLRGVLSHGLPRIVQLVGGETGNKLKELMEQRLKAIEQAVTMMRLQYPDYADMLQKRYLGRLALRLQETDYREMLEDRIISQEVFNDLELELGRKAEELDRRPVLHLGLTRQKLVAKVPFLSTLPEERIGQIAKMLTPRLVLPGEKVVKKGDAGDAMYFISTGCVEVGLESGPVQLGSGDFFGEIALLRHDLPRTADVTAFGYCDLLALRARDFHSMLEANTEVRDTIRQVAKERLKLDGLE